MIELSKYSQDEDSLLPRQGSWEAGPRSHVMSQSGLNWNASRRVACRLFPTT